MPPLHPSAQPPETADQAYQAVDGGRGEAVDAPELAGSGETKGRLLQLLGTGFGLAGAIGATLGAGILRTPGLVADELGSTSLFIGAWVVGGLYALFGAICATELATAMPKAGGWMVYAQKAFGPSVGFSVGWIDWLGHSAGLAWVAITIGEYATVLLENLPIGPRPIAITVVALFALIQLRGVQAGGGALQFLSLTKALAFIVLVIACFVLGGHLSEDLLSAYLAGDTATDILTDVAPDIASDASDAGAAASSSTASSGTPSSRSAPSLALTIGGVVVALQAVFATFNGWHNPIYFAEEFSEPKRDLPRSLIGGVLVIAAIYLLVNLALLNVLPLSVIAASKLPVADAARLIFGGISGTFITALVLLSLLGLVNATIMAAPRILYGLARDGLFARGVMRVNQGGTPVVALVLTTLTTCGLVLAGDFQVLLGVASFLYVALYLSGILSLLVLRRREGGLSSPFRSWAYPLPAMVVLLGSLAFLVAAGFKDSITSLEAGLLIAIGLPVQWVALRFDDQGDGN